MPNKSRVPRSKASTINAVQSPLGFFALVVLVVETMVAILAVGISGSARAYLVGGMLLLLFAMIASVIFLGIKAPHLLGYPPHDHGLATTQNTSSTSVVAKPVLRGNAIPSAEQPSTPWLPSALHHVSVPVRNLGESIHFYQNVLGLEPLPRPSIGYQILGAWFKIPNTNQQLHLLQNANGTFRSDIHSEVYNDCHFALRVPDVDEAFKRLELTGRFLTSHPYVERKRYPHFYTVDPDGHVIEINGDPK